MGNEIVAGIRNAMDRGASLESAMQTFVNAGYNPAEVRAAGASLSQGSSSGIVYAQPVEGTNVPAEQHSLPELPNQTKKPKSKKIWIFLIILAALVVFVSSIVYLIYALGD